MEKSQTMKNVRQQSKSSFAARSSSKSQQNPVKKTNGIKNSAKLVSNKMLSFDSFGEKFDMKLEADQEMLPTWAGAISTFAMFLAVAAYTYLKTDILINKKGFDIF